MTMIRSWVEIVACGAALSLRSAAKTRGREIEPGEVEAVARGAAAFGETISGAEYLAAVGRIHAYGREMAQVFDQCDILVSPVMAEPPAAVGRFAHVTEDYLGFRLGPEGVFRYSPFCTAFNASGQPAASVPTWWDEDGLPVGVQLAAAFGDDARLIALCREIEQARPWIDRRAPHRSEMLAKGGRGGPA
jgi:amidase/6-aminohexanoate-cyclic-dimer hydrolase